MGVAVHYDHPDLPFDWWSQWASSDFPRTFASAQLDLVVEEEVVDSCLHAVPHLGCHETSEKTQSVSIDDDKICHRRTYNHAWNIRENNFTVKGTIVQFHKTTSPIPTHTTRNVSSYDDYGMRCDQNVTKSINLWRSFKSHLNLVT